MNCPVCSASDTEQFAEARDVEYYTSDAAYQYRRCQACKSVFLMDPPSDRLGSIYPPNYYSYRPVQGAGSLLDRVKSFLDARLFKKLLRSVPGDSLNVLDVGGGSGWLLSVVRGVSDRVRETHEVDLNDVARAAAESSGHVFHCCRIEDFSSEKKFHVILMLNLLEHVAEPSAVLKAMRGLLAPGGLILVKTPNVDTLDCRIFRHHNWGGLHCPRHFVLFNRESLIALAGSSGLATEQIAYTQGAPQWACSILGWLGLRGWIRISKERPLYTHPLYPMVCALAAAFDFLRSPLFPTAQMFAIFREK